MYIAETSKLHVCTWSNTVKESFLVPSPRFHTLAYIEQLVEIVKSHQIDMLIPTCEEIIYISQHLDRFPKSCTVFSEPFEVLHSLHSKWAFTEKMIEHGFNTPKTTLIRNQSELDSLGFDFPYALKAVYSRASQSVHKVVPPSPPPTPTFCEENPLIAQEWIEGRRYCSYSICQSGQVKAHALYPVDYAIDGRSCLTFKAIDHPKIFEWVSRFVDSEGFTGQIAFDFVETERGQIFAIECNPRSTSGAHLFHQEDGIDKAFLNTTDMVIRPQKSKKRQIAFGMLLYGWRTPGKSLRTFFETLFSSRDVVFSRQDIKPFLTMPLVFPQYWRQARELGIRIPAAFTYDIDWNGQRSAPEDKPALRKLG